MESDDVPDDIWINIIESIDSPAQIAALLRTCCRFQHLGSKILLRELRWVKMEPTAHNINAWRGKSTDMMNVPRKLTLGVAFDFSTQEAWLVVSRSSYLRLSSC